MDKLMVEPEKSYLVNTISFSKRLAYRDALTIIKSCCAPQTGMHILVVEAPLIL
jgi:hypothetical protein